MIISSHIVSHHINKINKTPIKYFQTPYPVLQCVSQVCLVVLFLDDTPHDHCRTVNQPGCVESSGDEELQHTAVTHRSICNYSLLMAPLWTSLYGITQSHCLRFCSGYTHSSAFFTYSDCLSSHGALHHCKSLFIFKSPENDLILTLSTF